MPRPSWTKFAEGFAKCYNETGRYIVQGVSSCDTVTGCGEWVAKVANLWRTGGDIQANWASMLSSIHGANALARLARPGHFNGTVARLCPFVASFPLRARARRRRC